MLHVSAHAPLTGADIRALVQLLLEVEVAPADDGKDISTTTVITIEHRPAGVPTAPTQAGPAVETPYLTVDQAAAYCQRAPKTVLNHHSQGNLRSASVSRPLLFRREDLDAWLTTRPKKAHKR